MKPRTEQKQTSAYVTLYEAMLPSYCTSTILLRLELYICQNNYVASAH